MERIILTNNLAPGDICAMTPAIKAWKEAHPDFELGYAGNAPELLENNPHVNLNLSDWTRKDVRVMEANYPDIQFSHCRGVHFCEAYARYFSEQLRLPITLNTIAPDLYLSETELAAPSPIYKLLGTNLPYWVIASGHKWDCPIKGWEFERWQKVVDYFKGRILFVQIGLDSHDHFHTPLNGAINMVGKTGLRDLMVLMRHAQGVTCGVSFPMHLCAGLERPDGSPRPCVVVAGGREPSHWERYPWHRYLDSVGLLTCCSGQGCWKNNAFVPGKEVVDPYYVCHHTNENHLPLCMDGITPELVCFEITRYFRGGRCSFLTKEESKTVLNNEKNIIHHCN